MWPPGRSAPPLRSLSLKPLLTYQILQKKNYTPRSPLALQNMSPCSYSRPSRPQSALLMSLQLSPRPTLHPTMVPGVLFSLTAAPGPQPPSGRAQGQRHHHGSQTLVCRDCDRPVHALTRASLPCSRRHVSATGCSAAAAPQFPQRTRALAANMALEAGRASPSRLTHQT